MLSCSAAHRVYACCATGRHRVSPRLGRGWLLPHLLRQRLQASGHGGTPLIGAPQLPQPRTMQLTRCPLRGAKARQHGMRHRHSHYQHPPQHRRRRRHRPLRQHLHRRQQPWLRARACRSLPCWPPSAPFTGAVTWSETANTLFTSAHTDVHARYLPARATAGPMVRVSVSTCRWCCARYVAPRDVLSCFEGAAFPPSVSQGVRTICVHTCVARRRTASRMAPTLTHRRCTLLSVPLCRCGRQSGTAVAAHRRNDLYSHDRLSSAAGDSLRVHQADAMSGAMSRVARAWRAAP